VAALLCVVATPVFVHRQRVVPSPLVDVACSTTGHGRRPDREHAPGR
jgi:hypothetical protein